MGIIAQALWWFAFLLDVGLIIYFTKNYVQTKPRRQRNANLDSSLCRIAVAKSLTYPVVGIVEIAYGRLDFGFTLTLSFILLIYQDWEKIHCRGFCWDKKEFIVLPFSPLLAALVRIGGSVFHSLDFADHDPCLTDLFLSSVVCHGF